MKCLFVFPGKVERNFARLGRIMVQIAGVMSQRRRRESKFTKVSWLVRPSSIHEINNESRLLCLMIILIWFSLPQVVQVDFPLHKINSNVSEAADTYLGYISDNERTTSRRCSHILGSSEGGVW